VQKKAPAHERQLEKARVRKRIQKGDGQSSTRALKWRRTDVEGGGRTSIGQKSGLGKAYKLYPSEGCAAALEKIPIAKNENAKPSTA